MIPQKKIIKVTENYLKCFGRMALTGKIPRPDFCVLFFYLWVGSLFRVVFRIRRRQLSIWSIPHPLIAFEGNVEICGKCGAPPRPVKDFQLLLVNTLTVASGESMDKNTRPPETASLSRSLSRASQRKASFISTSSRKMIASLKEGRGE